MVFSFGTTALIKHSGDYLGGNLQYVHFNGNLVSTAGMTVLFTFIFGVLTILISNFISGILHKKLINKINKEYPNDKIIYFFYPSSISVSIVEFFIGGGFIGGYIIPFFIFDEITHIDMVTRQNLFFFILAAIGMLVAYVLFKSYTLILTDRRIIGISYGDFVRDTLFLFKDIKTIQKTFGGWEIISKDEVMLPLKCHPGAKIFYKKLKELLRMENK